MLGGKKKKNHSSEYLITLHKFVTDSSQTNVRPPMVNLESKHINGLKLVLIV